MRALHFLIVSGALVAAACSSSDLTSPQLLAFRTPIPARDSLRGTVSFVAESDIRLWTQVGEVHLAGATGVLGPQHLGREVIVTGKSMSSDWFWVENVAVLPQPDNPMSQRVPSTASSM